MAREKPISLIGGAGSDADPAAVLVAAATGAVLAPAAGGGTAGGGARGVLGAATAGATAAAAGFAVGGDASAAAADSATRSVTIAVPVDTREPRCTCSASMTTRLGRGHVDRRLIGFECQQRRIDLDAVADLDQHVDDGHVMEVAQVGHLNLFGGHADPFRWPGFAALSS